MPFSNFLNRFLKGYKAALNTKTRLTMAPFNFHMQLTSFLHEAVNHKVEFFFQFLAKNDNVHAYNYAHVAGKLAKKSTK